MAFESFALVRNTVTAPNKNYGLTEIKSFIEFTIIFLKILNNFESGIYFLIRSFHISAHFLDLWTLLPGAFSQLALHTPPTYAPASILRSFEKFAAFLETTTPEQTSVFGRDIG